MMVSLCRLDGTCESCEMDEPLPAVLVVPIYPDTLSCDDDDDNAVETEVPRKSHVYILREWIELSRSLRLPIYIERRPR
jgi:hypothetical protein